MVGLVLLCSHYLVLIPGTLAFDLLCVDYVGKRMEKWSAEGHTFVDTTGTVLWEAIRFASKRHPRGQKIVTLVIICVRVMPNEHGKGQES